MKTIWKVVIILIAAGLIFSTLGMSLGASRWIYWDKHGAHIVDKSEEKRITRLDLEQIKNIDINAKFSDVEFIKSDKYGIDIRYYDEDVTWDLSDGNLKIRFNVQAGNRYYNNRFFDVNLSFDYPQNYIKVYLPADIRLGTVSVQTDSGHIKIGGFRAAEVQINNSFGNLDIYSITCDKLQIKLDSGEFSGKVLYVSGDIVHKNKFGSSRFETIDAKNFRLDSDSGDVTLSGCRVESIDIRNDFGSITTNNLVSLKTDIDANSAEINISGEFSGRTNINNNFGSIRFTTAKAKEDYTYDIYTDFGYVTFDNNRLNGGARGGNSSVNSLYITNSSGDIQVYFAG